MGEKLAAKMVPPEMTERRRPVLASHFGLAKHGEKHEVDFGQPLRNYHLEYILP